MSSMSPDRKSPQAGRLLYWLGLPVFWFVVALVVRLLYMLEQAGTSPLFYIPLLDEKEAVESAREILTGAVSAEPYFKAPAYSWLMAGVMVLTGNAWPWAIRILQHLAGAGLAAVVARLAGMLSPPARRRLSVGIAGGLAAFYAPLVRLEENLSLDIWVTVLQTFMLYALAAWARGRANRWVMLAGLLAAAAWLTRPTLTLILPVIAVWMLWCLRGRKGVLAAGIFLLPVALAMVGVILRNEVVSGQPLTMPWQGGFSFYEANRPGANGRYYLQSDYVETSHANPARQLSLDGYTASLTDEERKDFDRAPDYGAVSSWWFQRTMDTVRDEPAAWLVLMGRKLVYLFSDKEIFNYEDYDLQRSLSALLPWLPGRFGIVFPVALASLAVAGTLSPGRRRIAVLLWLYVVFLSGAIALYFVSGRMRMPLAPPLMALAGCTAALIPALTRRRQAVALVLMAVGAMVSWGDWWGVRSETMAHVDLARMSNAAWYRGRYEQALEFALESEKLNPDNPALPRLKAQALYNLGRLQEAEVEFARSVQVLGDETSRKNLEVVRKEIARRGPSAPLSPPSP